MGVALPSGFLREQSVEEHELDVPGAARNLQRALVVLPTESKRRAKLPVVVLLHGLGETVNPKLGVRAWVDNYGLSGALEHLHRNHLHSSARGPYLSDDELYAINDALHERPFHGLCAVCPFLPNPYTGGNWENALARYADYLAEQLLPAVSAQFGELIEPSRCGIAGVSLGGFSAIEAFLRRPTTFSALGTVQGAFSKVYALGAARRLKQSGANPAVCVVTSSEDPYRIANQEFARACAANNARIELSTRKGPHSQAWLRGIGTFDALMALDRALG
ncbi:MAG: alpha/beta hydrolase-fold protein [Polyangiaceae bacterium]